MLELAGLVFLGAGVALLSSFLGFGGGTIIVPLLPLIAGLDIKTTIATSLAVVTLNAANNTYNFHRRQLIPWKLVFRICSASVVFAVMSSKLTHFLDEGLVRWVVIAVFCVVAVITFLGPTKVPQILRNNSTTNHLLSGVIAGTIAGLGGIGGATVLIPLFIVGRWTANESVAPTGNAINMLTAFTSVATMVASGQSVSWRAAVVVLLTSTFLSHFARKKQHLLSENKRRFFIVAFLFIVILLQVVRALTR